MENRSMESVRWFDGEPEAEARYEALADALGGTETLQPQQALLLADLVRGDLLKRQLQADIEKRGMGEQVRNGRQCYWRDNKSVGTLLKLMDQQRRTLQALGLIAKDAPARKDADDDFDEF